ncbi:lactase/phlorizin hydrolase-like [Diorhabda sublineata]|uniref:lactase/phlorizin hydrolase-like n=1 Tax=Diorhabda sublineata TaxID=1163346 RepID=UPI0024E083FC|nr:lactase/phlorizin hydrolase-like [Diorhabda sublineata]
MYFLLMFIMLFSTASNKQIRLKNNGRFPDKFTFGTATSAYQTEGAWNLDGKGESIWDNFMHKVPSPALYGDTGDIACDSYRRYKEDIRNAAELGVQIYKFSIAWSRILPTGYANFINDKGLTHYKNVVKEILKYNMTPAVTIYHWDLPQRLLEDGIDWTTNDLIPHFVNYSRILIRNLPEVGYWITINEPKQICRLGYGIGVIAPGIKSNGVLEYHCAYIVLKSHAAVYRMFKKEFPHYTAKMSLGSDCQWIRPLTSSPSDIEAATRQLQFECGMYFHPLFNGDWPEILKQRIQERSFAANLSKSRLPEFTDEEIYDIKGNYDFLGINHYYTIFTKNGIESPPNITSYEADVRVTDSFDVYKPDGIYELLKWLTEEYGYHEILITELGLGQNFTYLNKIKTPHLQSKPPYVITENIYINDIDRIYHFKGYMCYILEAITDGINVIGIIIWNLMDDLEWIFGYNIRFGLYYIDFEDPKLPRISKKSAEFIKDLMRTRTLNCTETIQPVCLI